MNKNKHFTHLHLHTDYSLLDGAITIEKLIEFGKKNEFKSLAITDHGNIFGAVKFFQQAQKANIKPILGMETYFTEDISVKNSENKYYHLILLVQNKVGYKNLCKLISYAYQEGFYFKPRIDYKILKKHSEGLIVTTACLGGHIPSLLMQEKNDDAEKYISWFLDIFGKERFYLEVQPEEQKEQKILNEKLFKIAKEKNISCVAAGDCHYVSPEDREAHEIMLAIQTHHKITDPDRFTFGNCRAHIRTKEEMLEIFKDHKDAVWNSGKISDMCDFRFETGKLFFPKFEIPEEHSQDSYFKKICKEGLQKLISDEKIPKEREDQYWSRLNNEIDLICKMGYVGYFLVVSDFIQWARNNDIPVGPGRGSVAGSLVAWSLQITDVDPLKYNLLFERFLNPERISMPDIDIDFCIEGRDRVIDYVRNKYGQDKVCQIITFGTMMAKGVIKDVARVLGFPFEDSNTITDLIPDQLKINLNQAIEQEPKLKELINNNPKISKLFDHAFRLEGITRHASKHAAGIVISPETIDEVLPVYIPPKTNDLVTQYAMTELESLGFLKMDFLGLKNLTLINKVVKLIQKKYGNNFDITKIPLNDQQTFQLISKGETSGVFQLESSGIKEVLKRLQPEVFEDIIAVNALYRPGPLGSGMVDDFIERKHGKQKISYLFDELEPILRETYGVIVYQEQVIKIAANIAGYSLGEADILRKAMGKKKAEVMEEQRVIFIKRAVEKDFDEKKAGELFDLMAYFAGYGFNKSHSTAYALIAYQTAYLKAHYMPEFMACLISLEAHDADKMAFYLQEARDMHLEILPPTINESDIEFITLEKKLRFGLQGIKNVGHAALENILNERRKNKFKDFFDFCKRIDLRICNKRVIESLIYAGTFDEFPGNRAQKIEELPKIIDLALEIKKAEKTGQMGLFNLIQSNTTENDESYTFHSREDFPDNIKLEKEKEVLGLYISSQPLDRYKKIIKWINPISFKKIADFKDEQRTICYGLLKDSKIITTKKGDPMAFIVLEDYTAKAEVVIFPKLFSQVEPWIKQYQTFLVKGVTDISSRYSTKIKAQTLIPFDLIFEEWSCEKLVLKFPNNFDETLLSRIKSQHIPGSTPFEILFEENKKVLKINARQKIRVNKEFLEIMENENISIQLIV